MHKPPRAPEPPYKVIANALAAGQVIPFLGAAASICHRPRRKSYHKGQNCLPLGTELAKMLADEVGFPDPDANTDLALVASYFEHVAADRPNLRASLREVFNVDCTPGPIHKLLARIQAPLLMITTNYDDLLERAFADAHRPYYLVIDTGNSGAGVEVQQPDGTFKSVDARRLREALQPDDRPIIYKMHGSFDRRDPTHDTFLITEQDYVDVLGRGERSVPSYFKTRMRSSNFLFLGYSLTDWNVRVLVRKLRLACEGTGRSNDEPYRYWGILKRPGEVEGRIWQAHRVTIFDYDLEDFVGNLSALVP